MRLDISYRSIDAKARHATINRELTLLRRTFRIGFEARPKLVTDVPKFPPKLAESARVGFIEDDAFPKLLDAIKEPGLRALVMTAYRDGFRKSELENLLCLQLVDGRLPLFKGAIKNGRPRAVKFGRRSCRSGKLCEGKVARRLPVHVAGRFADTGLPRRIGEGDRYRWHT